jgi:hypothetical protein
MALEAQLSLVADRGLLIEAQVLEISWSSAGGIIGDMGTWGLVLFGSSAAELFPDISARVETDVMGRIWDFYERIQGNPSRKTKTQIALLERAIERADQRARKPQS